MHYYKHCLYIADGRGELHEEKVRVAFGDASLNSTLQVVQ
jgi:hypothetical protein